MDWPKLSESERVGMLEPREGRVDVVLDTDTYNEIDDQFAVVHAVRSPERINLLGLYAAPFFNSRSSGPGDGMQKSYEEILRLLERLAVSPEGLVHRGSPQYLPDGRTPVESEAAKDLVEKAMARADGDPLYVAAIGAITNVASAILMEPQIIRKIVLIWLAGQPHDWPSAREFNLQQDVPAAQVIFDCGVPLVQVPCTGSSDRIVTTRAEVAQFFRGRGAIGDYLYEIFDEYMGDGVAQSKVIWDIAATSWLVDPDLVPTTLVPSPILNDNVTWSRNARRHLIRVSGFLNRDGIFRDVIEKLPAAVASA